MRPQYLNVQARLELEREFIESGGATGAEAALEGVEVGPTRPTRPTGTPTVPTASIARDDKRARGDYFDMMSTPTNPAPALISSGLAI